MTELANFGSYHSISIPSHEMSNRPERSVEDEEERVLVASPSIGDAATSTASAAISTVKKSVTSPESEQRRWKRAFENNAKDINGEL